MSSPKLNPDFDIATFLKKFWQQKPTLLKQLVVFDDPLSPDELAGLACEEEVESRLITGSNDWKLKHGPSKEAELTQLPSDSWTLLIQGVDLFIQEFRDLRHLFNFIPKWRFEDVMASFATPRGGAGPHFDHYDVFLVQGAGQRHWQLGQKCRVEREITADSDLRLLENFISEQEFILNPGDVLYVPPQYTHWGEAISPSFCYSVGFRAPSAAEMLEGFSDALIDRSSPATRFISSQHAINSNPHEISVQDLNSAYSMIQGDLADQDSFSKWFGALMTMPKYPELFHLPEKRLTKEEVRELLTVDGNKLYLNPASRLAYVEKLEIKLLYFFVDGRVYSLSNHYSEIITQLCGVSSSFYEVFCDVSTPDEILNIILDMLNKGSLLLDSDV